MISPLASIAPGAKIGKNVIIQPFAYIEDNVEIGDDCIIMPYASVLNGTRLGKGNKVYQHAYFGSIPTESSPTDNYVFADMVVIPDNQ